MTLALFGGQPEIQTPLLKYNSIGQEEAMAVERFMQDAQLGHAQLSGFLGGVPYGGDYVQALEERWATKFGVTYAIACNSATSGLYAAARCVENGQNSYFKVSSYTMSATAAAPSLAGMLPDFCDIDPDAFSIVVPYIASMHRAVVATNLFGHPADLHRLRALCDAKGALLIEDNAQSPLAKEGSRYAGTIGHIGVFSLNVHKHIQCGEGGVVVTNERHLADKVRAIINHGEMASQEPGLNLRMTEYTAAIALSQLGRIEELVQGRVDQATKLQMALEPFSWIKPQKVREGCTHVYYVWPFKYDEADLGLPRSAMVKALAAEGFPLVEGYVDPLYRLRWFQSSLREPCPVAEQMHDKDLVYFENCGWSPTDEQIWHFAQACRKLELDANVERLRSHGSQ